MKRYFLVLLSLILNIQLQAQNCDCPDCWVKTELYFGMSIPTGGKVTNRQWRKFLYDQVTPSFPEGSTVLKARGQWRDSDTGKTVSESTRVLVLMYEQKDLEKSDQAISEMTQSYIESFEQQAVIRADALVKVRFYLYDQ